MLLPDAIAGGLERARDVAGELGVIQQVLEDLGADGIGVGRLLGRGEGLPDDLLEAFALPRRHRGRDGQGDRRVEETEGAQRHSDGQDESGDQAAAPRQARRRAIYQPIECAPRRGSAPPRRVPFGPTTDAHTAPARQS